MQVLPSFVVPAQIRAARALLNLSQEQLAKAAGVGVSTLRDIEAQRGPASVEMVERIRAALDNHGVLLVDGDATRGPGVQFAPQRPHLIRRPTAMTLWDGLPLDLEWQGRPLTAFVSREALADLEGLSARSPDSEFFAAFDKHSAAILEGIKRAARHKENFDPRTGALRVRGKDLHEADESPEQISQRRAAMRPPRGISTFAIQPTPARRWNGDDQGPSDHPWIVHQFAEKEGILTIANAVTGHFLALHEAQVGGFEKLNGEWVLRLNVQLKFEDGRLRVEWLPDEPALQGGRR
ncbi:MAG: helix-turn-helix domain-containing protein [Burkholderiales bacterium]|nr:helix-turn-helix domain-containing protein [Burkholderiales bacterium]